MSDKAEVQEMPTTQPAKATKKRKCVNHCKRFWWLHLIIFICIVVLVVCLVIFVGVPRIAQSKVDDADLDIEGVNVLDSKPDSILMEINSTITTDGSIKAKIYPFTGDMYIEELGKDSTFASVDFPETSGAKHQKVNVSQHMNIADMETFTTFNTWFIANKSLEVTVDGRTKVKPSGLDRKYGVDFKKTVEIAGLNNFDGTDVPVESAQLSFTRDDNGRNFYGEADIPNASVFTLDIGNVTFGNYVDDEEVGTMYINNLFLRPGNNRVRFSADVNQTRVVDILQSDKYCRNQVMPFQLRGRSVVNRGQNLTYFADALRSSRPVAQLRIGDIIENTLGSRLGCRS